MHGARRGARTEGSGAREGFLSVTAGRAGALPVHPLPPVTDDAHRCADEAGTVVLDVTALSHGADAVARHEGRVVFLPRAAPGDRVRARLVWEGPSYARAEMIHRCVAGAAYREPPCPWVETCGGCPWQHVAYATQIEAKAGNVREALARIGGVTAHRLLPIIPSPREWGYRQRIRLHVGARREVGYLRPRSHRVVEIGACTIADPLVSAIIPVVRRLVDAMTTRLREVELVANRRGGVVVLCTTGGGWREKDADAITRFLDETPAVAAVRLAGPAFERCFGDPTVTLEDGEGAAPARLQSAASFLQVNPDANRHLVEAVVAIAAPAVRVLDLFCGAGNLSLPLAHAGAAVVGVDRDARAVADARRGAAEAGLAGARFEVAAADRFLAQQGLAGADLVLLDQPRGGAPAVAARLGALRPPRLLYVSCDPATLARDVRTLARAGFRVERVQPIDLFPQTEHVETVLEAVRG